ncbi:MAG: hypothetical protein JNL98_19455 [Bryobacterales bacterium]|nr:hypothetical protein [Bryobacterales bacterium]
MTLTFFHTAPANEALFEALIRELAPGIPTRHVVEPQHLEQSVAAGQVTPEIDAGVRQSLLAAIGPETGLLVCTCSTIGGCADRTTHARVPITRIDRAMAEQAVAAGRRILIAACVPSTLAPTRELVEDAAARAGRQVNLDVQLMREPWDLFLQGDKPGYWAAIAARLRECAADYDAIVLAQASMAGAAPLLADLPVPVLASPRIGVEAAIAAYLAAVSNAG